MNQVRSLLWLAAGALLVAVVTRTTVPVAAWLALTFLLRGTRTLPGGRALAWLWLALYAALAVGNRGVMPIGDPFYFFVVAVLATLGTLPFALDRLAAPRLAGLGSTLVFPMAWVAVEFLRSRVLPSATFGALGYTQYGNLPLMQLAAFTGIWGISFLIAWLAAVVNGAWEQGFARPAAAPPVLACASALSIVLLGGSARLALAPRATEPLRAAVVTFPLDLFAPGEVTRILSGRLSVDEVRRLGPKVERLHDWFLEKTEQEARGGARLVAWPETALIVFAEDEPAFLARARRLAAEDGITLAMGMGTVRLGADHPTENKIVLVDPTGRILFSYLKSRPVAGWEASVIRAGDGRLPVADTPLGRIAAAICFDADFPELVRQVGQAHADLWILPVNDWPDIKRTHFEMAAFRAIENGAPLLRAASRGVSGAFDPWGRELGMTDHFSGAPTMVAQVPVGGVPTLYASVGDLFAWLCVAGAGAALAAAGGSPLRDLAGALLRAEPRLGHPAGHEGR
jgi:apolipoprotein N-acyltransferase